MVVVLNTFVGGQSDLEASASAERRHLSLNHKSELDDERTANEELRAQLRKLEQQVHRTQSVLCVLVAFDVRFAVIDYAWPKKTNVREKDISSISSRGMT
jgi:hypothetical protein